MKKAWLKILVASLFSLFIGVLVTSILFTSGIFKLNIEEKIDYHLPILPEGIDSQISCGVSDSIGDVPDVYNTHLTYKLKISDNLSEMAKNADLIVRGRFINRRTNFLYPQAVEYNYDISRLPLAGYPSFEVTEVIKGELYRRELLTEDSPYYNRISIETKIYERILLSAGVIEHYVNVPDPLYIEPELETEYILFLNQEIDEKYDYVSHSLSEPLYIKLSGTKAELLCNLIDYKGYLKSECDTSLGDKMQAYYYGTKINFKDDITGKTLDEIKAQIK
ncbi:MAG: hypothetical protein E7564_05510 [Ruminococcaceae bacterium]|nr:hypothetical protein [Oscillospiraceae bacterium]